MDGGLLLIEWCVPDSSIKEQGISFSEVQNGIFKMKLYVAFNHVKEFKRGCRDPWALITRLKGNNRNLEVAAF